MQAEEKTVNSKGQAEIYNNNISQAKDEALQDAFVKAIKRAVGVYIKSSTMMEDMQVVENNIYSKAEGYINNYNIVDEYSRDDIYVVEIQAVVSASLRDSLEDLGFILKTQAGNPRVMLLVEEENAGSRSFFSVFGSQLSSTLSDIGFELVDNKTIKEIQKKESTKKIVDGDYEAATALGQNYGADIIIHGKTFTEYAGERELSSSTLYVMKAYGDIRAVTTQDGRIIASINSSASSYASSKKTAGNNALKELTGKVEKELIRKTVAGVNQTSGQKNIKLVVNDAGSFSQLTGFEKILEKTRGIESYNMRNFSNGLAEYDLKVSRSTKNIAVKLDQNKNIQIKQFYSNRLEIVLQ